MKPWRELQVSIAVMAHPSREDQVVELVAELDDQANDVQVVWDEKNDRWDTGSRSMAMFDPEADWHLVIQDDVILCEGFVNQVRQALTTVEEGPVCFYMGKGGVNGVDSGKLVRRGRQGAYRWVAGQGPTWGPAVAIQPKDIPAMLEWCNEREKPANYDLRMQLYFRTIRRRCLYSLPSLVEHRTGPSNPSLVRGRGHSAGRRSAWFEPKPWQVGDWNANVLEVESRPSRVKVQRPAPPPTDDGGDRVCAILMPAWRAHRYIGWAIDSIANQVPLPGWRYELRIGVDACPQTAARLGQLGRPFWWSDANVGPFLIRNSLAELAPADAYATFDADDEMKPEYLSRLIPLACPSMIEGVGEDGIAGSRRLELEVEGRMSELRVRRTPVPWSCGVAVFSRFAWESLEGFRPWRIAADRDMVLRARAKNIPVHQHHGVPKALYWRRIHPESLTQREDTGHGSEERDAAHRRAQELLVAGELDIKATTVPLRLIGDEVAEGR